MHRVLVTVTDAKSEQNSTDFTVTDHQSELNATVPNWWPSGGPEAGMVITLWGHSAGGVFRVDRWLELTHGTGPAPAGPYPFYTALQISSGRVPENRMVWTRVTPFALDPQDSGDGDIHVQTFEPCPAAGLTTENTPPLRGYVDRPAVNLGASSTDTGDQPSSHLGDAPPVGVPVMMLGAVRYDYGFGWYEIHPIRAWRYLTAAELAQQQADCAGSPIPQLGPGPSIVPGQSLPLPFGAPPCTDGSEFGNVPGFSMCGPVCYVAHTEIDKPETLKGPCMGVMPIVTRSQESRPQSTPGDDGSAGSAPGQEAPDDPSAAGAASEQDGVPGGDPPAGGVEAEHFSHDSVASALEKAYGHWCRPLRARAYTACVNAMARLAGGETRNPARACALESRRRARHARRSAYAQCVSGGRALLARLRAGARAASFR